MKRGLVFGFVAAGLLFATGFAKADYCLTFPTDTPGENLVFIGKGFNVPAKNACKAWIGFSNFSSENSPSSGTACRSADGKQMNIMLHTGFPAEGTFFEEDQMSVNLSTGQVSDFFTNFADGAPDFGGPVSGTAAKCSKIPVPNPVTATVNADSSAH